MKKKLSSALEDKLEIEKLNDAITGSEAEEVEYLNEQDQYREEKEQEIEAEEETDTFEDTGDSADMGSDTGTDEMDMGEGDGDSVVSPESPSADSQDTSQDAEEEPDEEEDKNTADDSDGAPSDKLGAVSAESLLSVYKGDIAIESADILYPIINRKLHEAKDELPDMVESVGNTAGNAVQRAGSVMWDGLKYLKEVGVEYGPAAVKAVFKTIYKTLAMVAKALLMGIYTVNKYITRKIQAIENLKADIDKIEQALNKSPEDGEDPAEYTKDKIIAKLQIDGKVNIQQSLKTITQFMDDYFLHLDVRAKASVSSMITMMHDVIEGDVTSPEAQMKESFRFNNFNRKQVIGYSPASEFTESYCYQNVLPGEFLFIGYFPKPQLTEPSDISAAYNNCEVFFGTAGRGMATPDSIPALTRAEIEQTISGLKQLCDKMLQHKKIYENMNRDRRELMLTFKTYARALATAKNKVSVYRSLSGYIDLKLKFVDHCYIAPSMHVHDLVTNYILAVNKYLLFSIGELQPTKETEDE